MRPVPPDLPQDFRAYPSLNGERPLRAPTWPSANCGDLAESIHFHHSTVALRFGGTSPKRQHLEHRHVLHFFIAIARQEFRPTTEIERKIDRHDAPPTANLKPA
jgi:hypothetical protein